MGDNRSVETDPLEIKPRARTDKLLVRRFNGDLMVYDRGLDRASCSSTALPPTSGSIATASAIATIAKKISTQQATLSMSAPSGLRSIS